MQWARSTALLTAWVQRVCIHINSHVPT